MITVAKKWFSLIIFIVTVFLFVLYFMFNFDKLKILSSVNLFLVLVVALTYISSLSLNGLFIKSILKPYKKQIGLLESFYVSLITSIGNFFAPAGSGMGLRAVYLKKKHGLAYKDYLTVLAGNYVLVLLVSSFFGLISILTIKTSVGSSFWVLLAVFFVTFIFCSLMILNLSPKFNISKNSTKSLLGKIINLYKKVLDGWSYIVSDRKLLIELILITVLNFFLTVFLNYILFSSLNISVTFSQLIIFSVLSIFSIFINITPANIGVKEAVYFFSASVIGLKIEEIISLAIIDRAVYFFVIFILWVVFNLNGKSKLLLTK